MSYCANLKTLYIECRSHIKYAKVESMKRVPRGIKGKVLQITDGNLFTLLSFNATIILN